MTRVRMVTIALFGLLIYLPVEIVLAQLPSVNAPSDFGGAATVTINPPYWSNPAYRWIGVKAVQDELKLTDEQKQKINSAKQALDKKAVALEEHPGSDARKRSLVLLR